MAGRKLIYMLLMGITAYIGLMYESTVPGLLLAFECFLLLLMFLVSFLLKAMTEVRTRPIDSVVDSGEQASILITLSNRAFLPLGDAVLHIDCSNVLDDEYDSYEVNIRIPARGEVKVPFTFSSSYCGVVKVELVRLDVYDYMRLFRRKKKIGSSSECVIMPKLHEMQLTITEACRNYDSDSEEFDKHKAGDDPSEIFQVREYRQGDKLSRVHWKLTARTDVMMVKELSLPISNSVGIYLDLRLGTIEEAQYVFELCYSLSMALLAQECPHRIFWCRSADPILFEELQIRTPEDITEGMAKLLIHGRKKDALYWDAFRNAYPLLNIHRMIAITGNNPKIDMQEFLAPDPMIRTVLTMDDLQELIEI